MVILIYASVLKSEIHYLLLYNSNKKDKNVVSMKQRSFLECAQVQQLLLPIHQLTKQ